MLLGLTGMAEPNSEDDLVEACLTGGVALTSAQSSPVPADDVPSWDTASTLASDDDARTAPNQDASVEEPAATAVAAPAETELAVVVATPGWRRSSNPIIEIQS